MGNGQRAPRLPEAEWERWRHELVRLFVEENVSRKEIIHIMANKHGFHITEKQLKHRFEKWDVKRNINDDDMTTMLALKRKFQAIGKDLHFQYKGHNVEEEKLERAGKRRRRELASPTFIQPYIKVYTSSNRSPQPASQAFLRGYSPSQGLERQSNSQFNSQNIQASFPMHLANDGPDPCQGVYTRNTNEPGFVEVAQTSQDGLMTDAALVPMNSYFGQETVEGSFDPNGYWHLSAQATSKIPLNQAPNDVVMSPPSPSGSTFSSGVWASWMNLSPTPAPPELPIDERSSTRLSLPRNMIPSPAADFVPIFGDVENKRGSLSMGFHVQSGNDQPITCENFDPSSALLSILLMKAHLGHDFCSNSHWKVHWRGSNVDKLHGMIHSEWLRLELDNVICWISETVSKNIRQHQAQRRIGKSASHVEKDREPSAQRRRSDDKLETNDEVQSIGTAYAQTYMHRGALRVSLGKIRDRGTLADAPEALTVTFVPEDCRRTMGLCATFIDVMSEVNGPRISPRLRTFNVVPEDSEIISCVKRNDLNGLQMLFDKREASPTDVDPRGFSLLSYAMYYGDCEIFRLLLEGGADAQNCDGFGHPLDMVWATWRGFSEAHRGGTLRGLPNSIIQSIDQCLSMSDAALRYRCDIDNSIPYNSQLPNPLFSLIFNSQIPPKELEIALRYLCNIGYDIEERNAEGATFLLSAATQLFPSVVSTLGFLIEQGADLHTVSLDHRGALHFAFEPPPDWGAWHSSCTDDCDHFDSDHEVWAYWRNFTDRESCAEDYCDDGLTPAPSFIDEAHEDDDENNTEALEVPEGYVLYYGDDGSVCIFRKPLPILKTRLRFKLLTLLRAGCDPNVLDDKGNSPSDCARSRRLWPEWTWALLNAGYVFDEDSDRCVKRVEDEVTSGS